jgi:hypothetical protein
VHVARAVVLPVTRPVDVPVISVHSSTSARHEGLPVRRIANVRPGLVGDPRLSSCRHEVSTLAPRLEQRSCPIEAGPPLHPARASTAPQVGQSIGRHIVFCTCITMSRVATINAKPAIIASAVPPIAKMRRVVEQPRWAGHRERHQAAGNSGFGRASAATCWQTACVRTPPMLHCDERFVSISHNCRYRQMRGASDFGPGMAMVRWRKSTPAVVAKSLRVRRSPRRPATAMGS